jgi:hypothetical protein
MASFQIADGPVSVSLSEQSGSLKGSARFSVTNTLNERRLAVLKVRPDAGAPPQWFSIEEGTDKDFEPGETRLVTVGIAIPLPAPTGEYRFAMRVLDERDPNNDWSDSAPVRFTVPIASTSPPPAPVPTPTPDPRAPIYVDAERRIDSEFARFGTRSIAVAQIGGINQQARQKARVIAVLLLLTAAWLVAAGFSEESLFLLFVAVLAIGGAVFFWRRTLHLLLVTTGGHETEVMRSRNKALVSQVRDALERAVAAQARA